MDKQDIQLTDLLSLQTLQAMQDNCAEITGLPLVLIDHGGYHLTNASGFRGIYALLGQSQKGRQISLGLNRRLCAESLQTVGPAQLDCPYSGLLMAAVPIYYQEEHLASWLIGHTRIQRPDEVLLRSSAAALGVSFEEMLAAAQDSPAATLRDFDMAVSFLKMLSVTAMELADINYTIIKNNKSLLELSEQLDSTAQMLIKFTNSADVGMYVTDFFTGEILQANEYFARIIGSTVEELVGTPCWKTLQQGRETFCEDCPHDKLLDERGYPGTPVVWERYYPDQDRWMRFTNQAIYWVDGRLAHMVTFTEITGNKKLQQQLERLAYYDRSMELPNILKLEQDLRKISREALGQTCLICFDIVALRNINNVYGRHMGDFLLQEVVAWTIDTVHKPALLYRLEGDAFCLAARHSDPNSFLELAETIRERFDRPWICSTFEEELHIFCGISLGVIHMEDCLGNCLADELNLLSVIERTLLTARKDNKIAVYNHSMDLEYKESLRLELSLQACVQEGMRGFEVYYQPIVDPVTGLWCSLEALCRWNSPEFGSVSPGVFIRIAELTGFIGAIGRWVLEQSIAQCKAWGLDKLDHFILDVNLSPAQMTDEKLVASIIQILEENEYPGEKLSLEITESVELDLTSHTFHAIERLRTAKIKMVLDDFGTGYSSFNNLKNLPVSILKTERAFLKNIENDSYLQYLFYIMTELAHAVDKILIAEGVETKEQLKVVVRNGVDYVQGYLFSKPLPACEMEWHLGNFISSPIDLYALPDDWMQTQRLMVADNRLAVSPRLYRLLVRCMQKLLSPVSVDEAIDAALQIVGSHFGVSRAYVFWRVEEGRYANTHEWCAADIDAQKGTLSNLYLPEFAAGWEPHMREHGGIVASDVAALPQDIHDMLAGRGIKALASVPVWDNGTLAGFVGFDDCKNHREWQAEENAMLHNLCLLVASVMERKQLQDKAGQQSRVLRATINALDMPVFISDPDTHRILLANDHVKRMWGEVEGEFCHQVVRRQDTPCAVCKMEWLRQNPDAAKCASQIWDPVNMRHYSIHDTFVEWEDGRQVYLEYAFDITEQKECQARLEERVSTDGFTQTLNRDAFVSGAQRILRDIRASGGELTLCLVDVDGLGAINHSFGHEEGDTLVVAVARTLREALGPKDIVGRYGGSTFALTLHGHLPEQAEKKMLQALARLARDHPGAPAPYGFRYGLVSWDALPGGDGEEYIKALLALADKNMA